MPNKILIAQVEILCNDSPTRIYSLKAKAEAKAGRVGFSLAVASTFAVHKVAAGESLQFFYCQERWAIITLLRRC
jgi:hypothetical protein